MKTSHAIRLLLILPFTFMVSAEEDGSVLNQEQLVETMKKSPPVLPPGVKTRSLQPTGVRTRSAYISPEVQEQTQAAIELGKARAVRLNLGASVQVPTTKETQDAQGSTEKDVDLTCEVVDATVIAFRFQFVFKEAEFLEPSLAAKQLDAIATAMKTFYFPEKTTREEKITAQFLIEGHTCDLGTDDINQKLSEKRALAVHAALITRGVPVGMLLVMGQGESSPVVNNSDESQRALNRRVTIARTVSPQTAAK